MIDFSFIAVLLASFLGSPHCAGMCGGFAIIASQDKQHPLLNTFSYNLGRLFTYVCLGVVAFYIGNTIEGLFANFGIDHAAGVFVGVILIVYGITALWGKRILSLSDAGSAKLSGIVHIGRSLALKLPSVAKSFVLGLSTTLLPCGWLYVFVLLAAKAPSVSSAMIGMFGFWLGTLPVLLGVGLFGKFLSDRVRHIAPTVSALLIIFAGVFSLYSHFSHSHSDHQGGAHHGHHQDGASNEHKHH